LVDTTRDRDFKDLVIEVDDTDFRVHRSAYTSAEILERERESVFRRNWLYVGHTSEIPEPGDYLTRSLLGEPLILARDASGEVHVFFNACRHRAALVCREATGNAEEFRCFYHGWIYKNSGELFAVTNKDAFPPSFEQDDLGLESPRFDVYRDFVFMTFDRDAVALDAYLESIRPYLDPIIDQSLDGQMEILRGSHLYSMGGNWKLILENSIDGYHALPVHITYFQYLISRGYDVTGGLQGHGYALAGGHAVLEYEGPVGRSVARPVPSMSDSMKEKIEAVEAALVAKHGADAAHRITHLSRNILVYPNLLIIDGSSLQVRVLDPLSPEYTDVSAWGFGPVGEDRELREHRIRGYLEFLGPGGLATPDDCEAIEACQRGFGRGHGSEWSILSKGIHRDPADVNDEEQIRGFWRQWQDDVA
jgi:p-cumate 2,3-dioxygenase subunit alpha